MYRSVPGLEHAKIVRNAYAIEYDCIDARQLKSTLEFKNVEGLFSGGQFNGSSGYEEAAAQGLVAGINAARKLQGKEGIIIDRSEGYIGVLIDDLVTKESHEPYRMMTSRAEYRLLLRQDNADLRLTKIGYEVGLIEEERYQNLLKKEEQIQKEIERVESVHVGTTKEVQELLESCGSTPLVSGASLADLIRRPEATFTNLSSGSYVLEAKVVNADGSVSEEVNTLKIHIHPPFYLSIWAFIVYIILIGVAFYLYRKRMLEKQRVKFELQSKEDSIKKTKELNELKLNFFTNVSHELRTPLTLIISPLVSMIREERDESKRRKLEMIHRNATRLLNLVNQILDFRKIDQNKEKLTLSHIDIVSFVDNICTSFRTLANSKVTLAFDSTVPSLQMSFDADKVGKIVNNLLSNAYKFTPDGGFITVSLSVALRQRVGDKDSDMLRISVSDTGKGISDKEKEHVFERFYQVNGTEMQPQGGSGIGLNLVKKFAELHGGKVDVTDNPSGGTIFMVDLPIESSTTSNSTAHLGSLRAAPIITTVHQATDEDPDAGKNVLYGMSKHAHQPGESMIKKPVVLLVDDSEDFREFMNEVLTDYTVVEAVNGQDAWNKIIDRRPDIILSDVMMPVMDGNELCRMCKDNDETTAIPFIMLSARMGDEQRKESLKCGADEYIAKPFDIDMLNLCILNLLKKRKNVSTEYVITEADRKFIDEVNAYIRDNMSNPETSVESLSTHLSISRVQLYKRMISLTGITPSEYLRTKRIKFAEHLLRSADLNISEIAYKVGFNNPRYFTKYFQDAYGVTPSQYRKNLSESE
jgi:signal transduction histidine kinase/DNA-binding response OmpR family regulator